MNWAKFLDNWSKTHPVTEPEQDPYKLMDALIFGGKKTKKTKR